MAQRSPRDVLDDHLKLSLTFEVEEDLARNYADDVVFLTGRGVYRGYDGARQLADMLEKEIPGASFDYVTRQVEGDVGFLEWTARSAGACVRDGADSYVSRDGRIVAPPIHYTVEPLD